MCIPPSIKVEKKPSRSYPVEVIGLRRDRLVSRVVYPPTEEIKGNVKSRPPNETKSVSLVHHSKKEGISMENPIIIARLKDIELQRNILRLKTPTPHDIRQSVKNSQQLSHVVPLRRRMMGGLAENSISPCTSCTVTAAAAMVVTLVKLSKQSRHHAMNSSIYARRSQSSVFLSHKSHRVAAPAAATSAFYPVYAQFAAGALAGSTATYSTHWLDTIKVKMQASPTSYTGGVNCLQKTLRNEGLRGLYQGATPAVAGHACKASIVFMCYGACERVVLGLCGDGADRITVTQHAAAGAMTGVLASFVLCPMELVKCRMQAMTEVHTSSSDKLKANSPVRVAKAIVMQDGPLGLYRGLTGIWSKEIPGSFIYFGSYEMSKSFVQSCTKQNTLSCHEVFGCGVFAGLCYCGMYPVESAKTRVQLMNDKVGFFRAFYNILKTEGIKPLMSGLRPSILRACVFSGIQFLTYEKVKEILLADRRK